MSRFKIAVVVMVAKSNRYADLRPLIPQVLTVLSSVAPGQVVKVGG